MTSPAQPAARRDLAVRATTTPSVEAPAALEVLVDVLLEAGELRGVQLEDLIWWPPDDYATFWSAPLFDGVEAGARATLRMAAVRWARLALGVYPAETTEDP